MQENFQTPDEIDTENPMFKKLRKCQGYEGISDEQAQNIIDSIKEFSLLMYTAEGDKKN